MYDVVVVGGGPSGLNAASRLAEKGLDVLVLERKNEIGKHIICTGIVGQEAFEEFDILPDSILREINKIKLISPMGKSIIYEHPLPFAYVVDRKIFDDNLSHEARSKGAKIKLAVEVLDISVNKDKIEVSTSYKGSNQKKYSAQMAIIATGINYRFHKKLGLGYPSDFLNGVQAELSIDDVDCTHLFVGNTIAPGAFAWLVPIGNKTVRLGLMTERDPRKCFRRLIDKIKGFSEIIENKDENKVQVKAIAQGLVSKTYGDRVVAIGEAAGQVKTSTGGGIYFGLICSDIASKVIIRKFKKGDFSTRALAEYERLWKSAIKKEILTGYYARKICGKLSDDQIEKVFKIARNDGIIPLIRERGNFDWHSDLIMTMIKRIPLINHVRGIKTKMKMT